MSDNEMFEGCTILVVEDELFVALDLCDYVRGLGCKVMGPESTVEDAMATLETQSPDFAFLDENLAGDPVTPVAEMLERRGIPFAIVSGYITSRTGDFVLEQAPRVAKPTSMAAILAALKNLHALRCQRNLARRC